ncbi:homeobox TGIF2-like [Pelobates cultripes]|uniref:Homeobox TGIF2-like n=1 Tax=Pelobates cultripes TaxID=61616 RepID=A0AAD1S6Q7_PELCU|nr:homeobox TGIF2-like [Pelobates cultripes]
MTEEEGRIQTVFRFWLPARQYYTIMEPNVSEQGTSNARNEPGTAENCKHLPKIAVSIMYKWLEDNCEDPYPKDIEKAEMIEKTGLTRKQVEDWFINARRRALPNILKQKGLFPSTFRGGKKKLMPAHTVTASADALPSTSTAATLPEPFTVSQATPAWLQVRSPPEVQSHPAEAQSYPAEAQTHPAEAQTHPAEVQSHSPEVQSHPPEVQSHPPEVQSYTPAAETPSCHCEDRKRRFQVLVEVASRLKEELDAEEEATKPFSGCFTAGNLESYLGTESHESLSLSLSDNQLSPC